MKWDITNLTYFIKSLPANTDKSAVAKGFSKWNVYLPKFTFTETNDLNANIIFDTLSHSKLGLNNGYAESTYPNGITQTTSWYNIDYQWDNNLYFRVALHEIGHIMGLDHSNISTAIMFLNLNSTMELQQDDDISRIQTLYGVISHMNPVQLANDCFDITGDNSFEVWFKAGIGQTGVILGQTANPSIIGQTIPKGHVPVVLIDNSGYIRTSMFWHNQTTQLTSLVPYNDGNWHYLGLVFNKNIEILYIDGKEVNRRSSQNVSYATSYNYFIGAGFTNSWQGGNSGWMYYDGELRDWKTYKSALSPEQIVKNAGLVSVSYPPIDDFIRVFNGQNFSPTGWKLV